MSMYIYINYLNIFLIYGEKIGTRAGSKSRPGEPKIAEPSPLGAPLLWALAWLSYAIAPLEGEGTSDSL